TQPLHSLRDDLPRCVKAVYKELNASRGHAIAARNIAAEVRFSSPLERLRAHREVALPSRESWAEGLGGRGGRGGEHAQQGSDDEYSKAHRCPLSGGAMGA